MIWFFKRYLLHNLGLKLLSLALATGLWFLISRDEQPAEVAVRAPIVVSWCLAPVGGKGWTKMSNWFPASLDEYANQ